MSDLKDYFLAQLQRTDSLAQISSLLSWDEQVNLPPSQASAEQRASQASALAELRHREFTSPEFAGSLEELEKDADPDDVDLQVILRETRRDLDRARLIPPAFIARRTAAHSAAYHAWKDARKRNDYAAFAPYLEENLRLACEEASFTGYADNPYDYHVDLHDPGVDSATIRDLFHELRSGLAPLAERILALAENLSLPTLRGFPEEKQETFLREVVSSLGFDFARGRLDVAVHPFCSGNAADTRLTTRYHPDNPLDSLYSSIHEAGHGLYEQGLPKEWLGTPLAEAAGMAVHESQSRIWENQVARSRPFWSRWEPRFRELFPDQLTSFSSEQLLLAVNQVSRNPIRVDADEVTYNLHVILRFELEEDLFSGKVKVKDLPAAWNAKAESILGLTPQNDAEGVLQDVHWSGGAFGYFPSYCLGNLLAAQLWRAAEADGTADPLAPERLLSWLGEKIHRHGRRLSLLDLTLQATGEPLSSQALLQYLETRYLSLYEAAS